MHVLTRPSIVWESRAADEKAPAGVGSAGARVIDIATEVHGAPATTRVISLSLSLGCAPSFPARETTDAVCWLRSGYSGHKQFHNRRRSLRCRLPFYYYFIIAA